MFVMNTNMLPALNILLMNICLFIIITKVYGILINKTEEFLTFRTADLR